jgi:hypothetical protein
MPAAANVAEVGFIDALCMVHERGPLARVSGLGSRSEDYLRGL